MNVEHKLSQLKSIRPDPAYALRSRAMILQHTPLPAPVSFRRRLVGFVFENLQIGSALALTSIALLVFVSGPEIVQMFSPLHLASVDRGSITAEAEAVDIQIQLTDLAYHEPVARASVENTASPAPTTKTLVPKVAKKQSVTTPSLAPENNTEIQSPSSIDDALDVLAK